MKNKFSRIIITSIVLSAFAFSSCGGSGNRSKKDKGDESYNVENLSVTKIETDNSVLKAGHQGTIQVTMNSLEEKDAKNVPVTVMLLKNSDTETSRASSNDDESGQHYAGTYVIDVVKPGLATYSLTITVPKIEGDYANYSLMASLYEKLVNHLSGGTNPTDDDGDVDVSNNNDYLTTTDVDVDPSLQTNPDLVVENGQISDDVLVLFTNSLNASDSNPVTFNYKIKTLAKDVSNAKVKFYISHLDGTMKYQLQVKDQSNNTVNEISLPSLTAYQELPCSHEIVIPSDVINTLVDYVQKGTATKYPFIIEAVASSNSEPAGLTGNNSITTNFWIIPDNSLTPDVTEGRRIGTEFYKRFGNSFFGAGLKFYSWTGIDKSKIYSLHHASIPVSILRFSFDYFNAELNIRGYFQGESTDGGEPGVHAHIKRKDLSIFGTTTTTLFSTDDDVYYEWKTTGIRDGEDIINELSYTPANTNGTISFAAFENDSAPTTNGPYSFAHEYEYSTTIMVGPIPVTIGIGIGGYAGFGAFGVVDQVNLAAGLVPYCGLYGYAFGGIGLSFASVGVRGRLDLIQLKLNNIVWTDWEDVMDENNIWYKQANLNEYTGLRLNLLKGSVYAYARYPWPRFKKKWGIWYFAGFYTRESTYHLWGTNWLYTNEWPILPKSEYNLLIPLDD